jgi:hypothetical protein
MIEDEPHRFEWHGLKVTSLKGTRLKGTGFSPYIIPEKLTRL